ncbi:MAG: DUF1273 domain-containing protein [Oscillospiraceae bacterium]|nr:DUF1273 domain-containing protein [Oscillospiraceae bacterium]
METKTVCAVIGTTLKETEGIQYTTDAVSAKVNELVKNGTVDFLCHAGYGFPLQAAEAVIALRDARKQQGLDTPQLCIIAPHESQSSDWSDEARERYYSVHEHTDGVSFFQNRYSDDCYEKCEQYMIDNSDCVLCDDETSTAAQYAKSQGKTVVVCEVLSVA